MRRFLRRAGPWLPLGVLAVELIFVWFGSLPLRQALLIAAALEALVWLLLMYRSVAAARTYRRARTGGTPRWTAAERALGEIVPPKLARLLIYDLRGQASLARWLTGRHPARTPGHFAYHQSRTPLIVTFLTLVALEVVGTHLVLVAIVGNQLWVWVLFALDAQFFVWLLGLYASMIVLPHRVESEVLYLRYGYMNELVVPHAAIRAARAERHAESKNGKLTIDGRQGEGWFSCGETTVRIELDPAVTLMNKAQPVETPITALHVTADNPRAFVSTLKTAANAASVVVPGHE